jgi:tetratricopeptide (TPR) repeat protein/serine/threonine protein kinase
MKYCPKCTTGFPDSVESCPTHNGMLSEIIDLKPGMLIRGTYRIVRKLGEGGFGSVYLAEQTLMDGELRTIKFLSRQWTRDEAFTARFRREVRALRQLRHKNIVDCGDLERAEDDSLFFSMEFVDGPDLRDFLHQAARPLDVGFALSLVRGIAAGLEAAHARKMVHRDIKPDNILLMRDGDGWIPKIADFGIVATKESAAVHTMTGSSLLTMAYAAPEQWLGMRAAELDGRTDLYALGGVFYEMLTGRTVFDAESYESWAREHLNAVPRPPSELRPDLLQWRGLDALVIQLLAKDRADRPKDVAEVLRLLDMVKYVTPSQRQMTVPLSAVQRPASLAPGPAATVHPATTVQPAATVHRTVSDAAPVVQERELTAQQWFERGNTRFGKGDFAGAIKGYSEAIRLKPDYAVAFNCQGSARFGKGDFEGAIEDYSEAIRLNPDYAVALTNRGNARCGKGDFEGAIKDYGEAIRLKPDYEVALTNRGNARCGQGDFEGAIKDCSEAIRLKPDYADAFNNRGNARKAKGDFEGALKDYREAIRLKPDYADAFNNRGNARFGTGDFEGAIKDYNEAIHLKPDCADAFNNRGNARKAKSDFGGAIKDYSEAIRLKPDHADAFTNRGNAQKAKGDLEGAIKDYSEVIRLKPGFAVAFNNRGSARFGKGDFEGAIKDYSEAIRLKPDYAVAFNNRGNARKAKGDLEGATEDHDEAIRLKTDPFKSRLVSTR